MANLLDYLDWRGDLTLDQSPFNEVDNLILAELSFVDFTGIIPGPGEGDSVPLEQAAAAYFEKNAGRPIEMGVLVPSQIPEMLRRMAAAPRFRDMKLSGFVDHLDTEKAEQFAALSIQCGDGAVYLAFRGTDDTLAGWKEDFYLSCMREVPAQKKAVEYTAAMARQHPRMKLRLGGHSKGGNLAVWAGVFCPAAVQRRVQSVWSNDGPGFHEDILSLPQHIRIADRIHTIVPKSSVVGMLLEHEEDYTVVDSSQQGLMQHDGFSWCVKGPGFVHLHSVTRQAQLTDQELRGWVQTLPIPQREQFIDSVFQVLEASGAKTLTDLKAESFKAAGAMVKALKDLDKESREALLKFVHILFMSNLRMTLEGLQEETELLLSARKTAAGRKSERAKPAAKGKKTST